MHFSVHPLRRLIAQGEGETLDFKKTISSARKIAKTLSAFANTRGGRLLVGVRDNGKVAGTAPLEEVHMVESAATFFCDPPVHFDWVEHTYKGLQVVEIQVPESRHKPHLAKDADGTWLPYIRVNDHTLRASDVMLDVMKRRSSDTPVLFQYNEPEQQLLRYLSERGSLTRPQATQLMSLPTTQVTAVLVNLILVGVLNVQISRQQEVYTLNPLSDCASEITYVH